MQKKSKIVIGLVVVVAILFIVYLFSTNNLGPIKNNFTDIFASTTENSVSTTTQVQYKNSKYGFRVSLPDTWSGYDIVNDSWSGYGITSDGKQEENKASGPTILIRHPKWTEDEPRQDIPVMIFTITQWNDMQADVFHIGAAPINPSELTRNQKYVFALPARYNFSYLTGYEEVDEIVRGDNVKAF